jgi:hypothetical protein
LVTSIPYPAFGPKFYSTNLPGTTKRTGKKAVLKEIIQKTQNLVRIEAEGSEILILF